MGFFPSSRMSLCICEITNNKGVCINLCKVMWLLLNFFFFCKVIVMGGLNYSEAGFRIFWEFYVDLFKFDFADFFPSSIL